MNAAVQPIPIAISRPMPGFPVFVVDGRRGLSIRGGTEFAFANGIVGFEKPFVVSLPDLSAGCDYYISINAMNDPIAVLADGLPAADVVGGFHFATGGNATGRNGGDDIPSINPLSIWDAGYRPDCPDPRGMALVEAAGPPFWCDIYLLGTDHLAKGTSRYGETIADGYDRPASPEEGKAKALDYPTAVAIYAYHGKTLLTYDEFREAAIGVTEKTAAKREPKVTGLDAARTSRAGIMQATGNMWVWGTDGDPDEPRPSIFGGSWFSGGSAGSRYAVLDYWPGASVGGLSARGRCGHLAA